jgi:hypothetical protein
MVGEDWAETPPDTIAVVLEEADEEAVAVVVVEMVVTDSTAKVVVVAEAVTTVEAVVVGDMNPLVTATTPQKNLKHLELKAALKYKNSKMHAIPAGMLPLRVQIKVQQLLLKHLLSAKHRSAAWLLSQK